MEEAKRIIESLTLLDEPVIVACSGGPDSMYLLSFLRGLKLNVVVAHVNHKVRKESDEEYQFLCQYCKENRIPFEGIELRETVSSNFESYARKFRYDFFKKIADKYKTKYIFTAHHGDDLMETILMRLARGSSLKGYAGFKAISTYDEYIFVRPFLYLTKEEILNRVKNLGIPYVIDDSNESDDYTRNRYRHHFLPLLKEENKNMHLKYIAFSEELYSYVDYIEEETLKKVKEVYKDGILDIPLFLEVHPFMQKQVLRYILNEQYKDDICLINHQHIEKIVHIIANSRPNLELNLPNGLHILKRYDKLLFTFISKKVQAYNEILKDGIQIDMGKFVFLKESTDFSNNCLHLLSQDISLPLHVRSRKDGDKIVVKNMNGSKKIKDIFIDSKIPFELRESWPIVTDDKDVILWVPGLKKSNFDVSNKGLCDIIVKYEKGRNIDE